MVLKGDAERVDTAVWVFIYSGLLLLGFGIELRREASSFGWPVLMLGAAAFVIGALLVWVRSRMRDDAER